MNTILKKILRDYNYHQETLFDIKTISDEAEIAFREELQKKHPDAAPALLGDGKPPEPKVEQEEEKEEKDHGDKEFKKIYRRITMLCHPDRIGDDAEMIQIYQQAVDANDRYDWGLLLKLSMQLNIELELDELSVDQLSNIKENTDNLKKEINRYENSMAYKWYLLKDLSAKEQFMLSCAQVFKNSLGIK